MDICCWGNVLLSQSLSFYGVLACAVWGDNRDKSLF